MIEHTLSWDASFDSEGVRSFVAHEFAQRNQTGVRPLGLIPG